MNPQKTHCVIIGGGLTGLSLAYWIQHSHPQKSIVILERESMASGASGRNAGFFTSGSVFYFQSLVERFGFERAQAIWNLSEENLQLVREHIIQGGGEMMDYQEKGALTLCSTFQEEQQLQAATELLRKALGPRAASALEWVQGSELVHHTQSPFFTAGTWVKHEGQLHPVHWLQSLWSLLAAKDVSLIEHSEVYALEPLQGRPSTLVKTERGDWEAEEVYVATNAFLPWLLPQMRALITPVRSQVLVTAPVDFRLTGPCYLPSLRVYFRQLPGGEILIGGMRHLDQADFAAESTLVTPQVQRGLEDLLAQIYFEKPRPKILQRWSGIMGFTANEFPLAGAIQGINRAYYLGGFSGHGMGYCFILAKRLVEYAQGGPHPTTSLIS